MRLALPAPGLMLNSRSPVVAPYLPVPLAMPPFANHDREPKVLGHPFQRGAT